MKRTGHPLLLSATFVMLLIVSACGGDKPAPGPVGGVAVEDAWIRPAEVSPDTNALTSTALYAEFRNSGVEAEYIIGGSTPIARAVEMHTTEIEEGVARMRQTDAIEIPAGESVTLQPGGTHIMLIELTRDLREGEEVPVTLHFRSGEERALQVPVRRP